MTIDPIAKLLGEWSAHISIGAIFLRLTLSDQKVKSKDSQLQLDFGVAEYLDSLSARDFIAFHL